MAGRIYSVRPGGDRVLVWAAGKPVPPAPPSPRGAELRRRIELVKACPDRDTAAREACGCHKPVECRRSGQPVTMGDCLACVGEP